LYGLKQVGRMWNKKITDFLKFIGFIQYKSDKCLFGKYNKENKLIVLLTLYVDGILIIGEDKEINFTVDVLKNKYTISKDSDANKIIGINIYKTKDGYKINQEDYINKIIKNYKMNKTKIINYPCGKISNNDRINKKPVDVGKK